MLMAANQSLDLGFNMQACPSTRAWVYSLQTRASHARARAPLPSQVVARCSLQRAAAYKPASTRQLNRVRKWLQASQANSLGSGGVGSGAQGGARGWEHPEAVWAGLPPGRPARLAGLDPAQPAASRCLPRVCPTAGSCAAEPAAGDIQLNAGQVRAIELASDAPLMVLTGGPGCGKTTAVQTIVKLWCAQRKMVRIAAPTGEDWVGGVGEGGRSRGERWGRVGFGVGEGRLQSPGMGSHSSLAHRSAPGTAWWRSRSGLTPHPTPTPTPLPLLFFPQAARRSAWARSRGSNPAPSTACWHISRGAAPVGAGRRHAASTSLRRSPLTRRLKAVFSTIGEGR